MRTSSATALSTIRDIWHTFLFGNLAIFEEHADGRRAGVVELSRLHRPGKRGEETRRHDAARHDQQHDDAHTGSIRRADQCIPPALMPTIVSELIGMRTAAASGVSAPASAS